MKEIILEMDKSDYPLVLRQYGPEAAKNQAIDMCLAQKLEITPENLHSCLAMLESGLAEMFGEGSLR